MPEFDEVFKDFLSPTEFKTVEFEIGKKGIFYVYLIRNPEDKRQWYRMYYTVDEEIRVLNKEKFSNIKRQYTNLGSTRMPDRTLKRLQRKRYTVYRVNSKGFTICRLSPKIDNKCRYLRLLMK